jgi:hypothetical protein
MNIVAPRAGIGRAMEGIAALALACFIAGCGGGTASIGGTVSGLGTGMSVTLQNNNTDNLTLVNNGGFSFPGQIDSGASYSVSVLTQPVGGTCVVTNGSGKVDNLGADITGVTVTCSLTASVGGTVTGLAAGNSVALANNGQVLQIAANGAFAFPGVQSAGSSYNVTVSTQPARQTCAVTNGRGVVSAGAMASVSVSCS